MRPGKQRQPAVLSLATGALPWRDRPCAIVASVRVARDKAASAIERGGCKPSEEGRTSVNDFGDEFDDDDLDVDDEEPTVPCPYCKREVHEDAQRCPYCEHYLSEEDSPAGRKPWLLVVGVIVCLYIVFRWVTG